MLDFVPGSESVRAQRSHSSSEARANPQKKARGDAGHVGAEYSRNPLTFPHSFPLCLRSRRRLRCSAVLRTHLTGSLGQLKASAGRVHATLTEANQDVRAPLDDKPSPLSDSILCKQERKKNKVLFHPSSTYPLSRRVSSSKLAAMPCHHQPTSRYWFIHSVAIGLISLSFLAATTTTKQTCVVGARKCTKWPCSGEWRSISPKYPKGPQESG